MPEMNSVELEYDVSGGGPSDLEAEIRQKVHQMLEDLSTNEQVRDAARARGIDVDQYDQAREQLAGKDRQGDLIEVSSQGMGIEPGTVVILVTIIPPAMKYVVAPVAVHVCKSIWDNFVLPELKALYKRFDQRKKGGGA
jgi:hypothetical protein